ncbi:hypothetical protein [Caballeronia sp. KNU42]
MKRNLFAELMEGVTRLVVQREAEVPVRKVETDVLSVAGVSAEEISAQTEAFISDTP